MNLQEYVIIPYSLKNTKSAENNRKDSIFIRIPRKIMIPLYSNLAIKSLWEKYVGLLENHPGFEIYFYNPRRQKIWMRKMFHNNTTKYTDLWEAFNRASTSITKRDIFLYSWLFMNGGVGISPEMIPKLSLSMITLKSIKSQLSIFFVRNGYFANDIMITTAKSDIFLRILRHCCNNILCNRASSPIERRVHLKDDSATGYFTIRKAFLEYIRNPRFKIPNTGFHTDTIRALSQDMKQKIFEENKEYNRNSVLLKQISLGYRDLHDNQ